MTTDKDFKRLVRDRARASGQSYASMQRRLRNDGLTPPPETHSMNIVRTIPDIRTLDLQASKLFYQDTLGFSVAMEHAGMVILASATQPKQQVTLNGDAADAMPLPPGFSIDVGYPDSVTDIHDRALAQGCIIIEKLEDKPIGIRRFSLLDPNGTRVTVMAHLDVRYQPAR